MNKKIIIIGAFHETIELCELCQFTIVGIIDNGYLESYMDYSILGTDDDAKVLFDTYKDCQIVISPDSSRIKRKLVDLYDKIGFEFATVISPKTTISRTARIGKGVIIQSGVNVSSAANISDFCKLNFNCNVMHDVTIGEFSIIASNAVVLGRAQIGKNVYIGANSTIMSDAQVLDETHINPAILFSNI